MILIKHVTGNPPYNGPETGRPPIYHTITDLQRRLISPQTFSWIVQYNWMTQTSPVGQVMRKALLDMNVFKIEDNRFSGFTEATVRTCNIYCRKEHTGDIELVDKVYNKSLMIDREIFKGKLNPVYSRSEKDLLDRLKAASTDHLGFPAEWNTKGHKYNKKPYPTFAVAVSYFADFENGAVGKLQVVGPDRDTPGSQRIFEGYDKFASRAEAETACAYLTSFWHSSAVRFILGRTLTSRTLDNPQISAVPVVPMDRIWDNQQLADYWQLSEEEKSILLSIEKIVPVCVRSDTVFTQDIIAAILEESKNRSIYRTDQRKDLNGEVFTPSELVIHTLQQQGAILWNDGDTFLDPTCGNGQFLAAIAMTKKMLNHADVLSCIHGIDLMEDNVLECRQRLLAIAGDTAENRQLVDKNIRQGNALDPSTYDIYNTSLFS